MCFMQILSACHAAPIKCADHHRHCSLCFQVRGGTFNAAQPGTPSFQAVSVLPYVGFAFAMLGYAIQQWAAFASIPEDRWKLLHSCLEMARVVCWSIPQLASEDHRQMLCDNLTELVAACVKCCKDSSGLGG